MQTVELTILFDHKAQIARRITAKLEGRDVNVHPVFYAYAQLAQQKTCPHSKMTLVRMLMQDQPELSSREAIAIACGLMAQNQTRLTSHEKAEDLNISIHFQDVDHYKQHINAQREIRIS
jgi:hypothetical protein